jgi:glycosyltransferase involved in cell wall biosynthesis
MLAPEADAYHAHDLSALPAAVVAARFHPAWAIYDSHEIFLDSGSNATRPAWARAMFARWEASLAQRTDALITVNEALAEVLSERLRPRRVAVVHNCPPRWDPPADRPDHLRQAAGIPAEAPVVLYHGAFTAHRGLETMAAALLEPGLREAHGVYLGYGSLHAQLLKLTEQPDLEGRLHVLDAVPPDVLIPWVASADVDVMALEASTLNHYLSTPNKLFEALAAGTPVVASDFPELRRILQPEVGGPLGELCRPDDVADVARAIRAILELEPAARAALRRRCLAAAHDRWNWETEASHLTELYARLPASRPVAAGEGLAEPA